MESVFSSSKGNYNTIGVRTKSWTPKGGYTKELAEMALREYERLGSIAAVIHQLGYPSESTLYRWYERKKAGLENRHGFISETPTTTDHHCNTPEHPRHPSAEFKYETDGYILKIHYLPQTKTVAEPLLPFLPKAIAWYGVYGKTEIANRPQK